MNVVIAIFIVAIVVVVVVVVIVIVAVVVVVTGQTSSQTKTESGGDQVGSLEFTSRSSSFLNLDKYILQFG